MVDLMRSRHGPVEAGLSARSPYGEPGGRAGKRRAVLIAQTLLVAALACSFPSAAPSAKDSPEATPPTTNPAAYTPPARPVLYTCYTCGGNQLWVLDEGGVRRQSLPMRLGQFYGYSPSTDRILYARTFADHGAGPGNVSVADLAVYDVAGNRVTVLLEDNVVEALWAPNGLDLAYILATPNSYELHWRGAEGSDRLLAPDVSFSWSFSPLGDRIAFTRESGYGTGGLPGLYVIDVETLNEIRVSAVDKSGTGGIADAPSWSFDGRFVLLSHWGGPDEPQLILACGDGSGEILLSLDPALQENWWYTPVIPRLLWYPDGVHLLGIPEASRESLGGPYALVRFRLDEDRTRLTDGEMVAEVGGMIGWDVPGRSVWAISREGEPFLLVLP